MSGQPCPHCQNTIRLPDPINPEALLQCPICKRVVRASQLLAATEQTWIVVDNTTAEAEPSTSSSEASSSPASGSISSGSEGNNPPSPRSHPQDANGTSGNSDSTPSSGLSAETRNVAASVKDTPKADQTRRQPIKQQDWSKFKPISHEEFQKKKKKSSSAWLGIVQVVLGGALAIPISLLLIWHVLGKDVGGIGKEVARYIPWIVPRKFHPYTSTSYWEPESSEGNTSFAQNSSIKRNFEAELAASLAESERKPTNNSSPDNIKLESKSAAPEGDTDMPLPKDGMVSKTLPDTPDITNTTPSDSEVLMQSIALTRAAIAEWPSVKDKGADARRKVANAFYSNLAQAVEVFAKVAEQPSSSVWKQQLSKLAREIAASPELIQLVRAGGFAKLTLKPAFIKPGVGMALIGTFKKPNTEEPSASTETADETAETEEMANETPDSADSSTDATRSAELPTENTQLPADDFPLYETESTDKPTWLVRIRRNVIANADNNETANDSENSDSAAIPKARTPQKFVRLRKAELHPTLLLESPGNDEYLLFVIAHSAAKDGAAATKNSADVIWFAESIESNSVDAQENQ